MIKEGDSVTANVVRTTQYGVYLEHEGAAILVLGPDASSGGDTSVEKLFRVGQRVTVRVGRFSENDNAYRGFIQSG
jgi:ribosomal protein S1